MVNIIDKVNRKLVGRTLRSVLRREYDWLFEFSPNSSLRVECPWRVLIDGRIALADGDDGHQFGLPTPTDAEHESWSLLRDRPVESVSIRGDTGDLAIAFGGGATLEALNMSSGYEGWEVGADGLRVIAMGGGSLSIFRC